MLNLTTDSWRDSAGALWTPNTLVPLSLPALRLERAMWLISSVSYKLDENGTTADLTIMPPGAFQPQPIALQPQFAEVHRDERYGIRQRAPRIQGSWRRNTTSHRDLTIGGFASGRPLFFCFITYWPPAIASQETLYRRPRGNYPARSLSTHPGAFCANLLIDNAA